MSRPGGRGIAAAALAAVALAAGTAFGATAGSPGVGDRFFPRAGNGGYDVSRYVVSLRFRPRSGFVTARALVDARATQALSRFNLDLGRLKVLDVTVNGRGARFSHRDGELAITPAAPLRAGRRFSAAVRYRGRPRPMTDPDGSQEGWFRTEDGAFVAGEPLGTRTWTAVSNHPTDKARWTFHLSVPRRLKAIANGRLLRVKRRGGLRTWTWRERSPMASYLATVNIGRGRLSRGKAAGIRSWTFVDPSQRGRADRVLARMPAILRFLERHFGPYPFGSTGAIVDRAPRVGYALETQTRPVFDRAPDVPLLVHELAHQWYGDSVSITAWREIWLNEGFATWVEWFWTERHGGPSAARTFETLMSRPASSRALWNPPPAALRHPRQLFSDSVYVRGALALQALRQEVGGGPFLRILRRWAAERRNGNGSTADFTALAESVAGRDLEEFFARWIYRPGKPG